METVRVNTTQYTQAHQNRRLNTVAARNNDRKKYGDKANAFNYGTQMKRPAWK